MKVNSVLLAAIIALCIPTFPVQAKDHIVSSVVKAPMVADGDVVSAATDVVIDLDTSLDPAVPGRTLLVGRTIKVILPDEFVNTGLLPLQDVFSSPTCIPGNLQCSTANVDLVPGVPLSGPGIKQIDLILNGFTNPPHPGFYPIAVEAETGPDGEVESGTGLVHILPQIRPSINVTSAFNSGAPNTIFQKTAPGELTPLPYDFLLWDRTGDPFEGVTVEMVNPDYALLRQGRRVVGHVAIETPPGATGQEVFIVEPSSVINAPISGVPTARLTAFFRVGSATGEYVVTFAVNGGNAVQMFVEVE